MEARVARHGRVLAEVAHIPGDVRVPDLRPEDVFEPFSEVWVSYVDNPRLVLIVSRSSL